MNRHWGKPVSECPGTFFRYPCIRQGIVMITTPIHQYQWKVFTISDRLIMTTVPSIIDHDLSVKTWRRDVILLSFHLIVPLFQVTNHITKILLKVSGNGLLMYVWRFTNIRSFIFSIYVSETSIEDYTVSHVGEFTLSVEIKMRYRKQKR